MKTTQFKRCQEQVNYWDFSSHSQNSWKKPPEIIQKGKKHKKQILFLCYSTFKMSILGNNGKGHSITW